MCVHTTLRGAAAALCTLSDLIVAGGDGGMYGELKTVDTETQQWSAAASLPMHSVPIILCEERIYILSMDTTCSLSSLSQSCASKLVLGSVLNYQYPVKTVHGCMFGCESIPRFL